MIDYSHVILHSIYVCLKTNRLTVGYSRPKIFFVKLDEKKNSKPPKTNRTNGFK